MSLLSPDGLAFSRSRSGLNRPAARYCLLVLGFLLAALAAAPARLAAELDISGQKEFRYRGYRHDGSFNQFIQDNPLFLDGTGFDQSLRLDVTGTLYDNVKLELSFDDSLETREDQKLLVTIDGRNWDLSAGRLGLSLDDTHYLLFNKKALGMTATGVLGKHLITVSAARPEGRQRRQTFRGNGSQQEFVLSDAEGHRNVRVVPGSDVVHLDSRRLERGSDYEIDYEEGSVLLRHHLLPIEPTSLVTIEFETDRTTSASTGTLLAVRDRYYFQGLDDPDDRDPDDEFVAVSLVTSTETDRQTTGPSLDSRLTVAGLDGQAIVAGEMLLKAELAASRWDSDAATQRTPAEDLALDLDLARTEGRLTFDLSHRHVGPRFEAVGRREFLRLDEQSDLIRDARLTRLDADYDVSDSVAANVRLDVARTNLDLDPALPAIDFGAVLAGARYNPREETSLSVRRRAERRDVTQPSGASGNQDRDVATAVLSMPLGGLAVQGAFEAEENDATLAGAQSTDYLTRRLNVGGGKGKKLGWSAGLEDQRRPGLGRSTSGQLLLDLTPLSTLKGNVSLLRRVDEGQLTPATTAWNGTTDTGEVRLRFQPNRKLNVDVKASAEQRGRVDRVRDPRLPIVTNPQQREPQTIVTEHPVLRLMGSNTLEYRPGKRFDHRLQVRFNSETDTWTDREVSDNRAANYRVKFAATERLRLVGELERSEAVNRLTPIERDQQVRGLSVMNAFSRGLSATLSRREVSADDHVLAVREDELTHGLTLEKVLSAILTAEAGLEKKSRTGRFVDDAWTAKAGARYSPASLPLRTEVSLEHSSIDGVLTTGGALSSSKDRLMARADYRFNQDTLVELSGDLTDAGPTVAGDAGYRAVTGEAKVTISF